MGRTPTSNDGIERRQELGRRIDFARELMGLKKSELAAACGVSRPALSTWISGRHTPNPENLAKICRATRQPASFFSPEGEEIKDENAFARELVSKVGASVALEVLALPENELAERLVRVASEAPADKIGAALRAVMSTEELETLLRTLWLASELETLPVLLDTVRAMTDGTAKAAGLKTGPLRARARRVVSGS